MDANGARLPPPQGPPPSYAFVTRVYKRSLRPVIICVAFIAGIWSLFAAIGFFRNAPYYNRQNAGDLATISIVLGALYMFIAIIEGFGIFAGSTQRTPAARIFAWLSALVFILATGIGLAKVVIHFTMKNKIINSCVSAVEGGTYVYSGFWGPISSGVISSSAARAWCQRSWDRGSWSEIIAFLAVSFLAAIFASVAFGFYRQLLDPTSVANAWRAPVPNTGAFSNQYAPPYSTNNAYPAHAPYPNAPGYGGGYQTNWAPPPGPPPQESKPPGYENWGYGVGTGQATKDPFNDANDLPQRGDGRS